jgi:hypothetical protein
VVPPRGTHNHSPKLQCNGLALNQRARCKAKKHSVHYAETLPNILNFRNKFDTHDVSTVVSAAHDRLSLRKQSISLILETIWGIRRLSTDCCVYSAVLYGALTLTAQSRSEVAGKF